MHEKYQERNILNTNRLLKKFIIQEIFFKNVYHIQFCHNKNPFENIPGTYIMHITKVYTTEK